MTDASAGIRAWGLFGAFWAALFAGWLLFFPERVPEFAWDVKPRLAQVFIGAGYAFRTGFFLAVAAWPVWWRIRWLFWGNLVFTGVLLVATFAHAEEVHWGTLIGHAWLLLYVFEPFTLIYLAIGRSLRDPTPANGGPLGRWFVRYLILVSALLAMFGALLFINPDFAGKRWPWPLDPFDARIASAWILGWAAWSGTMAFARDWDEIRVAAGLGVLQGVSLVVVSLASFSLFDSPRAPVYLGGVALLTLGLAAFAWRQERARTRAREVADGELGAAASAN